MRGLIINLCKSDRISVCMAESNLDQKDCSFYEKCEHEIRCMYFVFNEYCDSLNAQLNAKNADLSIVSLKNITK